MQTGILPHPSRKRQTNGNGCRVVFRATHKAARAQRRTAEPAIAREARLGPWPDGGARSPFVAYYAEEKYLSAEDVAELEKILKRHQKERGD